MLLIKSVIIFQLGAPTEEEESRTTMASILAFGGQGPKKRADEYLNVLCGHCVNKAMLTRSRMSE